MSVVLLTDNRMSISVNALIAILVVCFVVLAGSVTVIVVLVLRNRRIYGQYKRLRMESQNSLDVISVKNETVPSAVGDEDGNDDDDMDAADADGDDQISVKPETGKEED